MKQRPILFKSEMVQAILAGRKTQTRRALKMQPSWVESNNPLVSSGWQYKGKKGLPKLSSWPTKEDFATALLECEKCPYGKIGDQLWVREAWSTHAEFDGVMPSSLETRSIHYWADGECQTGKKRPSIHMPRWASRILLEITDIRVERLQDISEEDAQAEGCDNSKSESAIEVGWYEKPRRAFERLWESINGVGSWEANPWVWVVEFKVVQGGAL